MLSQTCLIFYSFVKHIFEESFNILSTLWKSMGSKIALDSLWLPMYEKKKKEDIWRTFLTVFVNGVQTNTGFPLTFCMENTKN